MGLGRGAVARAQQLHQPPIGPHQLVVVRLRYRAAFLEGERGVPHGDLVQHAGDDRQRRVARQLDQPAMEIARRLGEPTRLPTGGDIVGQHLVQLVERLRRARLGEQPGRHRLDARPRRHQVGDGGARQLEQQAGGPGHDLGAGHPHAGAGARAAADLDEAFGLQHAHRLAQGRPADAEMRHQLRLVGQEVAVLELAVDHHAAQRARDELGRLRRPDRRAPPPTPSGPIIGASGVLRATPYSQTMWLAV